MTDSRTKFYLDKQDGKYKGVCAGIAAGSGISINCASTGGGSGARWLECPSA